MADITSTLLSLSSMRKSNRETYGTCLNHNEESRFKSLSKHLLVRTVLLAAEGAIVWSPLSFVFVRVLFSSPSISDNLAS